ncbi:hypothetical protein VA249_37270 [Vibrio alfacsensis]|uniref:hypothetical protein n=1 Tax=Vibrio alfacsensis TaxID=1074311 RepID=UPI001BF12DDF|nr:hypothetical protein [Vibrio alfacsensis]BBM67081.1 hypothetical protein VA249_37270 [Vibrio alfacsensis]
MAYELGKSITTLLKAGYGKVKQHFRDKERNQKDFFLRYYEDVEQVMERHKTTIMWVNEEINSFVHVDEEDMPAMLKELEEHNKQVFENAFKASEGNNFHDMAVEIENLIAKHDGVLHESLILALKEYAKDCYEAHKLGEYHFLEDPSKNILVLVRDLKGRIPTVHGDAIVE